MTASSRLTAFDFEVTSIDGRPLPLRQFAGRVLLIVNTASACGFTPQLSSLQQTWARFRDQGLTVLGFPSNEFGGQDPGSNSDIAAFCSRDHGVDFPMMAKGEVNGPHAQPLWAWLASQAPGVLGTQRIKWNFTKFLVGRDGQVIARYAPMTRPESVIADIQQAIQAPRPGEPHP